MTLRISYCDGDLVDDTISERVAGTAPMPSYGPGPAYAEWDDGRRSGLLLYLADEPEIGRRFTYGGVEWEIIDYHDGWIAQLVV
jgi:hypothetical protein